jgi:phage/plasmid-like protein (TIGR03299 family)
MSHEITIKRNGQAEAAFSLTEAWHGLGTTTTEPVTVEELFNLAGLGWTVSMVPVLTQFAEPGGEPKLIPVPDMRAIQRNDTGFVTGVVSGKYVTFQNSALLDIAKEVFLDAKVGESAFSLFGGKKVVLAIRLGEDSVKCGKREDGHRTFLLLSTGHDGISPILALGTDTRVVCNNTFTLAVNGAKAEETVKIRHSAKHSERVADLVEALKMIREGHEGHFKMLRKLSRARLSKDHRAEYFGKVVDLVLPVPSDKVGAMVLAQAEADAKLPSLRERRRDDLLDTILSMYDWEVQTNGMSPDSAYTAFQSVSDAVEHVVVTARGSDIERAENKFVSRTTGKGAAIKSEAFDLLSGILDAHDAKSSIVVPA